MNLDRDTKSKIYKRWRYSVFVKDDWKCQNCGTDESLHAHHIIEWDVDPELRYEVSNGLTLCSSCHCKHHSLGRTPWNKGTKLDEEGRKKLSEAHKGQISPMKGKKHSVETLRKISESKTGKKLPTFTDEHKKRIGLANRETLLANSLARKGKTWIKCAETGKRIWIDKT